MSWSNLQTLIGSPISTVPGTPKPVTDSIFEVDSAYLMTVPYLLPDLTPSSEPIVSMLIWAPSLGALKRAFADAIEEDDGAGGEPPIEMRLAPGAIDWASIHAAAKNWNVRFMETGTYRFTDGAFVQKKLESRYYRAYFRSRQYIPHEVPYAVAVLA